MNYIKIIETIQDKYIYYESIDKEVKEEILGLKKKDKNFYNELIKIIDKVQDPHFNLKNNKSFNYILPINLAIIENEIIVVEECSDYPRIKKGFSLESFNGIGVNDFINRNGKYSTLTLKLMKILELLATKDNEAIAILEFVDGQGKKFFEEVDYVRFVPLQVDKDIYRNHIINFSEEVMEKYGIKYYRFPSLMDELGVKQLKYSLEKLDCQCPILLDLRNNMGGRIDLAATLTELFIYEKKIIYLKSRKEYEKLLLTPKNSGIRGKKVGILFNNLTCSSLEFIFLNSVANIENLLFMGSPTCGMSDIATLYDLNGEYTLSLTTKQYVDENGVKIKLKNIHPAIYISGNNNDIINEKDTQLEEAIEVLSLNVNP